MSNASGNGGGGGGGSLTAIKRLMTEYRELSLNAPEGITAGPISEDNFFVWEAIIEGPSGTPYEGGIFSALITFPRDYPLSPPQMRFTGKMFHPNVYPDGRVCISILHPPGDDPNMYESSSERWSPVQSVEKILLSVVSMLAEPNDESGANIDASLQSAQKAGMATAAAANESRSDLLNWINDLLQLSVTKIESIGTGAALCQIMDSIYGDVQMHKVKFNTNQEYEYINNFKVLQACFGQHGIDKFIPVDRLVKLKFQDNLEFLQWMKKFWDCNYPGGRYDAISRRKKLPAAPSDPAPAVVRSGTLRGGATRPASMATAAPTPTAGLGRPQTSAAPRTSAHSPPQTPNTVSQLQHTIEQQNRNIIELRMAADEMEKERDFYFNKLRDIEMATQQVTDKTILDSELFRQVTEILYKTEEGFEIPESSSS